MCHTQERTDYFSKMRLTFLVLNEETSHFKFLTPMQLNTD